MVNSKFLGSNGTIARRFPIHVGLVGALAVLEGCTVEAGDQDELGKTEAVASTSQALLPIGVETTWTQPPDNVFSFENQKPTNVPVAGNACFLTKIQGKFRGGEEWIQVLPMVNPKNGVFEWFIHGNSDQEGVSGSTRCVQVGSGELFFELGQAGNGTKKMGVFHPSANKPAADEGVCYLTLVRGKFQGFGENIQVVVNPTTREWELKVITAQPGVEGRAACIKNIGVSGPFSDASGGSFTPMGGAIFRNCALTQMTGGFHGGGEWIQSLLAFPPQGAEWRLQAGALSGQGTATTAFCF